MVIQDLEANTCKPSSYVINGLSLTPSSSEAFKGVSQLDEVTEELEKLWKVVLKELDKGTTKRHISGQQSQPHDEKPSMDKLRELMEEARKKFADKQDTKLGRAKAWFRSVAQTLHDHAYIGNIFPTNDRYTSVLIGAFTACIKVCTEVLYFRNKPSLTQRRIAQMTGIDGPRKDCGEDIRLPRKAL